MCAHARTRVPAVITSPTAGEHRVYFDGELEVGDGRGGAEEGMLHRCHPPGPAAPLVILPHYGDNRGGGGEGETPGLYSLNLTVPLKEGLPDGKFGAELVICDSFYGFNLKNY